MRYALIGCGRISPNHVVAAKNNKLEMVAFVDINEENARDKILKFDLEGQDIHVYTDYHLM